MKARYTPRFKERLNELPDSTQRKFSKQVAHLLQDLRHPSLRAKKYNTGGDIWQARVDREYRFYFTIKGETYIFLDVRAHPK